MSRRNLQTYKSWILRWPEVRNTCNFLPCPESRTASNEVRPSKSTTVRFRDREWRAPFGNEGLALVRNSRPAVACSPRKKPSNVIHFSFISFPQIALNGPLRTYTNDDDEDEDDDDDDDDDDEDDDDDDDEDEDDDDDDDEDDDDDDDDDDEDDDDDDDDDEDDDDDDDEDDDDDDDNDDYEESKRNQIGRILDGEFVAPMDF
ncbi:hypothetical protein V1477_008239 [Vespula maculifrons]|uniref:Uncharacterized protein n=1 Tax=Vespula maculifrons TaxID=7453 RepID=A0ABD2CD57_VESMC